MPVTDYAEWFRREQARRNAGAQALGQTATTAQTQTQMQTLAPNAPGVSQQGYGYQPISGSEARERERNFYTNVGTSAAQGYASGGEAGAILNAAIAAAPGIARAGRESWDAAKAGSVEGVRREIKPIAPGAVYLEKGLEKVGFPTWASPTRIATKAIEKLFGGPAPNIEKARWDRLRKYYGFDVPKPDWVDTKDAALKAQDKSLSKDFVGYNDKGQWVNNKFATTGLDSDLRPQDIQEFATNFETFGKEYQALPEEKRLQIMDIALKNNLVNERKGTVDIAWTPETYQQAANILYNDPNVQKWQASQPKVWQPPVYVPPWERK